MRAALDAFWRAFDLIADTCWRLRRTGGERFSEVFVVAETGRRLVEVVGASNHAPAAATRTSRHSARARTRRPCTTPS